MSTALPPRSSAVPSRASRSPLGRWMPGVLGVALLVGSGVMARMNPSATVEPPPSTSGAGALPSGAVDPACGTDSLREVLEDSRAPADVRANAATALGRCKGLDAIPTLLTRLQDREDRVREAVAVTLGRLGGQQVRQALEERLPLEERPLVREALQRGLTLVEP